MAGETTLDLPTLSAAKGNKNDVILAAIVPTQVLHNDMAIIYLGPVKARVAAIKDGLLPAFGSDANNDQLKAAQGAIENKVSAAVTAAIAGLLPFARHLEAWQLNFWLRTVKSGTGVDASAMLISHDAEQLIDSAVARSGSLVEGVSNDLRKRVDTILWNAVTKRRFGNQVTQQALAREIDDAVGISKRRAINTAADETNSIVADFNQYRQRQAGITEYDWHHTQQAHPRHWHKARNGKIYSWDHPPYDGHPGTLPYCKCTARALVRNKPDAAV